LIYIIGSIGAGKSSLTELLAKDLNVPYYLESVDNGLIKGMLRKFYSAGKESRSQVSAMLQVAFLTVRYQQLKQAIAEPNAVLDSNLLSDHILARNLYDRGEMDKEAYNVYLTLNQEMQSNVNGSPWNGFPDLIVYIDIDPEHEIEMIQSRSRDMEDIRKDAGLIDYYRSVNDAYTRWYNGFTQAPVIRIDREKYDFVNNKDDQKQVLIDIKNKLYELGKLDNKEISI
jgi:deoxyadenosine/deoxycytidine kinase